VTSNALCSPIASDAGPNVAPRSRGDVDRALRRDLCAVTGDGVAFSVMVGAGETYLPAFALAIGLGEVASGLIATLPLVAGAVLQLIAPAGVRWMGSYRRWIVACAVCQGLSFAPLVAMALWSAIPAIALFAVASLYWGAGMATGPAWNTWMGKILPRRIRARFFGRRTRFTQAAVLLGFLLGGVMLQVGAARGAPLAMFAVLFVIAGTARLVSAGFLAAQTETPVQIEHERPLSLLGFLARLRRGQDGRLMLYLIGVQTAVQISGPYFSPYMLRQLHFSYAEYVLLVSVSYLAKAVALPAFGRFAHRCGARRLLWVGGLGIVPVSGLWLVAQSLPWLLCVQVLGGVFWAAYELAVVLLFLESIEPEERTSMLTSYNLAHALATMTGSLIGGAGLMLWGERLETYLFLFGLSSVARAAAVVLLLRVGGERASPPRSLWLRTLALRPGAGSIERPILALDGPPPGAREAASSRWRSTLQFRSRRRGWRRTDSTLAPGRDRAA
jgi:MFS family permease